jgi:hypothetical protein
MWCCGYLHPVCLEATYVFWAHHCQHSPISRLIYSTCGLHQLAPPAGVTCNHVTAYVGVLLVCPPPKPRHGPGPSAAIQQPCYELAPPPPPSPGPACTKVAVCTGAQPQHLLCTWATIHNICHAHDTLYIHYTQLPAPQAVHTTLHTSCTMRATCSQRQEGMPCTSSTSI